MTSAEAVNNCDEELMVLTSENEVVVQEQPRSHRRWVVYGVATGLAVVSAVLFVSANTWYTKSTITARELIETEEASQLISDTLISSGRVHGPKELVRAKLNEHIAKLRVERPKVYDRLESMHLSNEQKEEALRGLRRLSDPNIHAVRKDIIAAIKETVQESGDHEALKRHLVEKLQPHLAEMRSIREVYYPTSKKRFATISSSDFDKMPLVQHFDDFVAQHLKKNAPTSARKLSDFFNFDDLSSTFDDFFGDGGDFDSFFSSMSPVDDEPYNTASDDPMECYMKAMFGSGTDISTCSDAVSSMFD